MKKYDKSIVKRLLPYIARHKAAFAASLAFALASVVLQLYVPIVFGDAIDCISVSGETDFAAMGRCLAVAALLAAASGVFTLLMNLLNNRIAFGTVADIRSQAIRHIQRIPVSYMDTHETGDLLSRVITDTDMLTDGLLLGFSQIFTGVLTIAVTLVFMFSANDTITHGNENIQACLTSATRPPHGAGIRR